ncbi:MAG: hypothetical protein LBC74_15040 [Planctomycetaceae bacterium]|jgi:hypothetical protein|nr:hypothetical protein [Planctomycetaceae bacterium]
MKELTIIDELKNLLPLLTEAEFTGLEESILKDGLFIAACRLERHFG